MAPESTTTSEPTKITSDELVLSELKGKELAIERYDSMLWKIRSGYIVVLYGALSLLGVRWLDLADGPDHRLLLVLLLLIVGFSGCAAVVDFGFVLAKLRVVGDRNRLTLLVLDVARGRRSLSETDAELQDLIQNSGESLKPVDQAIFWNAVRFLLPLYLITPVLATLIYLYLALGL